MDISKVIGGGLVALFLFMFVAHAVNIPFTPRGDVDLEGDFAIYNATYIYADVLNITNSTNMPVNWTMLKNYPPCSSTGYAITCLDDTLTTTYFAMDGASYMEDINAMGYSIFNLTNVTADILTDGTMQCTGGDCTGIDDMNATKLYQNGTKVLDVDDNTTMTSYVDAQDELFNSSMKIYVDALDVAYNTTMTSYVDSVITALSSVYCALSGCSMTGNLDSTGNVTAENVFIKSDIFIHTDSSQSVLSAGTWVNITFIHESTIKQRMTHTHDDSTNDTITAMDTGVYDFKFAINVNDTSANPDDYAYVRVVVDGVEITGSGMQSYISKGNEHVVVKGCVRAELTSGDEIKLQFTSSSTNTNLEAQNGYMDHSDSARLCLHRIR